MNIQRYFHALDGSMETDDNGQYVLCADHVAALRACEQRVRESMEAEVQRFGSIRYRTGVTDGKAVLESEAAAWATENYERGLSAARDAVVDAMCSPDYKNGYSVLAAIDALRAERDLTKFREYMPGAIAASTPGKGQ